MPSARRPVFKVTSCDCSNCRAACTNSPGWFMPGGVWTLKELAIPGRCVFYDRGRCTIHPVRPYECARMMHDKQREGIRLRHHIVAAWTPAALAPFAELTGKRLFGAPPHKTRRRRGGLPPAGDHS